MSDLSERSLHRINCAQINFEQKNTCNENLIKSKVKGICLSANYLKNISTQNEKRRYKRVSMMGELSN